MSEIDYNELSKMIYETTIESYNKGTSKLRQIMRIRKTLEAVYREAIIQQNKNE